jgi:hypothetical protein
MRRDLVEVEELHVPDAQDGQRGQIQRPQAAREALVQHTIGSAAPAVGVPHEGRHETTVALAQATARQPRSEDRIARDATPFALTEHL